MQGQGELGNGPDGQNGARLTLSSIDVTNRAAGPVSTPPFALPFWCLAPHPSETLGRWRCLPVSSATLLTLGAGPRFCYVGLVTIEATISSEPVSGHSGRLRTFPFVIHRTRCLCTAFWRGVRSAPPPRVSRLYRRTSPSSVVSRYGAIGRSLGGHSATCSDHFLDLISLFTGRGAGLAR